MKKPKLTKEILIKEAKLFVPAHSKMTFPEMYGVTDGKAVGTFIEHKFRAHLANKDKRFMAWGTRFWSLCIKKPTIIRKKQGN